MESGANSLTLNEVLSGLPIEGFVTPRVVNALKYALGEELVTEVAALYQVDLHKMVGPVLGGVVHDVAARMAIANELQSFLVTLINTHPQFKRHT